MKEKKKISIIGTTGIPCRYGGFETLAEELGLFLRKKYEVNIICSTKFYTKNERTAIWNGIRRTFLRLNANGLQSILYDVIGIFKVAKRTDILLILGGSATFVFPILRILFPKVNIVFHPDGLEWERPKWNFLGKWYLKNATKLGCIFSHKIVIDNRVLLTIYSAFSHKIKIIGYGGYETQVPNNSKSKYWLTIARAEEENNLSLIANAFREEPKQTWLVLSNYKNTNYGKRLFSRYQHCKNIFFLDANYNKEYINNLVSGCKGIIHGHSKGGTNPSLVTAMWSNKVVFCHDNIFNRETTQNLTEFFSNSAELKTLLNSRTQPVKELKTLAKKEYSWKTICEKYDLVFDDCKFPDKSLKK